MSKKKLKNKKKLRKYAIRSMEMHPLYLIPAELEQKWCDIANGITKAKLKDKKDKLYDKMDKIAYFFDASEVMYVWVSPKEIKKRDKEMDQEMFEDFGYDT